MPYTLRSAEEAEKSLFFRLDGEAAKRHGSIGYLRADFGKSGREFYSTWFDSQPHLKTPGFKEEFDDVINSLRGDGQEPPFASRASLEAFCAAAPGQELTARGGGYSIQAIDFSYYIRCNPSAADYDIYCYAYDNRWLLPELAGKHELPHKCFSTLPSSGEMILITRGERKYTPFSSPATLEEKRRMVDMFNEESGVTRAQEQAMLAGSMLGWTIPAACPWNYEQDGTPRPPKTRPPKEHER
ncbi:MAG: hypothetical protein LBK56_02575 [Gracilibacteraceae bacterium]|jgi:hypothetical protein|nr:hypothetical protein [Gracilibacteraceae bacterium]